MAALPGGHLLCPAYLRGRFTVHYLFIPEPLKLLFKSTLTSCPSLTPPESTLTKKQGREGRAIIVDQADSLRPLSPPILCSSESAPCLRLAARTRPPASSPPALPSSAPLQIRACLAPSIPSSSASVRPVGPRKTGLLRPHKKQYRAQISPVTPSPPEAASPCIRHLRRGHPNSNPHSTAACAPDNCSTDESRS